MPDNVTAIVADSGPLSYLVLIGHIDVLPRLFRQVGVPATVAAELRHLNTPDPVRAWASALPAWLAVHADPPAPLPPLPPLDPGEREAIALALAIGADLLLVDDRAGTAAARGRGLQTVGTVGLLIRAAAGDLLDLPTAFAALRATSFYFPPALFDALLEEHRRGVRRGGGP